MSRIGVGGAILLAWFVFPAWARQDPQPVPRFRSGVDLVVLDVSVLDRDRRPVRGLTADDFTILEDGRPQKIAAFSAIDLPDEIDETGAPWTRDIAPDVVANADEAGSRTIVLLLDDATPIDAADVLRAKKAAYAVIDQLGPRDLATVVFALDRKSGQEFTHDRARLRAAVDRFNGAIVAWGQSAYVFAAAASTLYFQAVDRLRGVAQYLMDLPQRRKALVFVSIGIPINIDDAGPSAMGGGTMDKSGIVQQLLKQVGEVFAAAQRANVAIYGLDLGGLLAPMGGPGTVDPESGALSAGGIDGNPGRLNRSFLQTLSENTGGFAIKDVNDVVPGVRQILRENSSYYLLAYSASNPRADGRFRKIDVRVTRPGVLVRARNGYFEPEGPARRKAAQASAVDAALAGVAAKSDLQMQVSAAPFAVPGRRQGAVAIVLGVRQAAPLRATRLVEHVELRVAAFSPDGRQRAGQRITVPVTLNAPGAGGVIGYELLSRIEIAPGRYYLRLAAQSSLHGIQLAPRAPAVGFVAPGEDTGPRSGSVFCDLDIPDFLNDALSLSGVVLSVTPGIVSGPKDALASIVPVVPTTLREFTVGDTVTAFVRAYQGGRNPLLPVALDVRVLDANDVRVFEAKETLAGERFATGRSADYSVPLPISRLSPGRYLFSIEAASRGRTVRRDVRFQVR